MDDLMDRLTSRKFWLAVLAAVLPIIVQVLTGELTWELAVAGTLTVVIAYVCGQGYVDGKAASATTADLTEILTADAEAARNGTEPGEGGG